MTGKVSFNVRNGQTARDLLRRLMDLGGPGTDIMSLEEEIEDSLRQSGAGFFCVGISTAEISFRYWHSLAQFRRRFPDPETAYKFLTVKQLTKVMRGRGL